MDEERLEYLLNQTYYNYLERDEAQELINYVEHLKTLKRGLLSCLKLDKEKIDYYVDRCEQLEKVLDEIREYLNKDYTPMDGNESAFKEDIAEILDKVKE